MTDRKRCRRRHLFRGKDHYDGCPTEALPHVDVRCRRCGFRFLAFFLFDPRPYEVVAA